MSNLSLKKGIQNYGGKKSAPPKSKSLEEMSLHELIRKVYKELGYSEDELNKMSKRDLIDLLRDNGVQNALEKVK